MNSESTGLGKQIATSLLILIGFILMIRLDWLAYSTRRVGIPETSQDAHTRRAKILQADQDTLKTAYLKAGKPLPKGGIAVLCGSPTVQEDCCHRCRKKPAGNGRHFRIDGAVVNFAIVGRTQKQKAREITLAFFLFHSDEFRSNPSHGPNSISAPCNE